MSATHNSGIGNMKALFKRHPLLATLVLFAGVVLLFALWPLGRKWIAHMPESITLASPEVRAEIAGEKVWLRWNALVNPWRHPSRELTFETELKLPLRLRNTGGRVAEIEDVRLLSQPQAGEEIEWEGLWLAEEQTWDPREPIEPQIQRHRRALEPFVLAPYEPPLALRIDFVPLDHAGLLPQGHYENRLQVREAETAAWVDVLHFGFIVPPSFRLEDGSGYRYQYWQSFPLAPSL